MKTTQIVIEPYEFLSYQEFICIKEVNEHGILRVKGIIEQNRKEEYWKKSGKEEWVCVRLKDEQKNEKIFFFGVITGLQFEENGQVTWLTLEIKTGSYLLDLVPHIQSFQNGTEWEAITNALKTEGGQIIIREGRNESISHLVLQYQETNWEFLKRMGNQIGSIVLPEFSTEGKRVYLGAIDVEEQEIEEENYKIIRTYQTNLQNEYRLQNYEYQVISREVYDLGNTVIFHNHLFFIKKVISQIKNGELYHTYCLGAKSGCISNIYENVHLQGVSLKANVLQVKESRVQVRIQEDENKENSGACWFDYATVYSSKDGSGWYCMPEIGDEVRLTFPNREEKNAYVASCVHLETERDRKDPSQKLWKNKQGKEIVFTPDSIIMKNNNGLCLELSDQRGILVSSNQNITLESAKDIKIESETGGGFS